MKIVFLSVLGASAGALASAGVFTVLIATALIPRFAGKTGTAGRVTLYENAVVLGTVLGAVFGIFQPLYAYSRFFLAWCAYPVLVMAGFFTGIFVGCLAISIAEMLDSIPIFFRRIRFKKRVSIVIFFIALGKLAGSFIYFWKGLGSE